MTNSVQSGKNTKTGYNGEEKIYSNKKTARIAGLFFLLMVVFGLFSVYFLGQ